MISASRKALSGATSLGFSTTVQPTASAGATFAITWCSGKFQGVMHPTTPTGSRVTSVRLIVSSNAKSRAVAGTPPVVAAGIPAWIMVDMPRGIPISSEMSVPISPMRAPNWPARPSIRARRSSSGVAAQPSKAARAAATAASTSTAVPAGTEPMTSSLDGLMTSMLPSPSEATHWPSM